MKILIVNSFDRDGGAARSARRLHLGLRRIGVESNMLVQTQTGDDPHTLPADDFLHRHLEPRLPLLDALPLALYPKRDGPAVHQHFLHSTLWPRAKPPLSQRLLLRASILKRGRSRGIPDC